MKGFRLEDDKRTEADFPRASRFAGFLMIFFFSGFEYEYE